ncbi:MAG: glycosyltransferase family 9 protein [Acidiferrobacter sp.]
MRLGTWLSCHGTLEIWATYGTFEAYEHTTIPATPPIMMPEAQRVPDALARDALQRILIVVPQLLGDAVVSSVLLTALKTINPHCRIDVLVLRTLADIFAHNPAVTTVYTMDSTWRRQGLLRTAKPRIALIRALRKHRYDLLIQSPHTTDGSWGPALIFLLRIPYAVGASAATHRSPLKRFLWQRAFSHTLETPHESQAPRHVAELHLDLLRRIGLYPDRESRGTSLVPGPQAEARIRSRLGTLKISHKKFVLFAPTAGSAGRTLDLGLCREFLAHCVHHGQNVVVTTGSGARERAFADSLCQDHGALVCNLSGQLSIAELIALVGAARVFVGTDSGTMHIAAAMHVPVVACFGPGDEHRFGPWQVPSRLVMTAWPCRPCDLNGCGNSGQADCLLALTATMLITAMNAVLA